MTAKGKLRWLERRPKEGGRQVVCSLEKKDLIPKEGECKDPGA